MKRSPIFITSILAIILAGYCGYLSVANQRLKRQLAAAIAENEIVEIVSVEASEMTEESVADVRFDPGPEGFEGRGGLSREAFMERRAEMREAQLARALKTFEDPELRMDMIERQMQRLDRGYADFFKRLNLPPEELDALKTLMAERTLIRMEAGLRASGATEEDRKAIREDFSNQLTLLSDDINNLLGEEDAKKLAHYSNTLEYRGEVKDFERSLSYSDTPLSERQTEGLVNAFAKVDKEFEYSVDINNRGGRGRGGENQPLTRETVDTYYQEREVYDALLLEQASKVLNEAQLASLAAQQISERERDYRQSQQALENPSPTDGRGGFSRGGFGGIPGGGRGGPDRGGRGR